MKLKPRELGHVLAGLRLLQKFAPCRLDTEIRDDGEHKLMTVEEIDRFCESLNSVGR
jgi:hypothetical protein